jgi:hypothetical protein
MPTGYSYFAERQLRSRIDLGHSSPQPWRPSFSAAQSMKRHGWIASTADEPKKGARARGEAPEGGDAVSPVGTDGAADRTPDAVAPGQCETDEPTRRTRRRRHDKCGVETAAQTPGPTMFFLDWDDTLLPTTHLRSASCITASGELVGAPPPSLRVQLLALEREVCDLLAKAQDQPGEIAVCIVTNASEGWVQSSATTFMPMVAAAIESRQIRVRHARTASAAARDADTKGKRGGASVLNPARWKADVFWEELAPLRWCPSSPRSPSPPSSPQGDWTLVDAELRPPQQEVFQHCEPQSVRIVSIGDSQWERTAASVVGRQGDVIVTVKLAANPSCAALRQQLRRIRQAMTQLSTARHSASINAVAQRDSNAKAHAKAPTPAVAKESGSTAIAA